MMVVMAGSLKRSSRVGPTSRWWSSLPDNVKPPGKRRSWTAVERALAQLEFSDTVAGRRRHLKWIEACVDWNNAELAGDALPDGQRGQATFRRG
jgi:hypothetical protein